MKTEKTSVHPFLLASMYAIVILIQLQFDIRISKTILRIGASDFFVPFFLIFMLYVTPKDIFQQEWKVKWLPIWFITFTFWLGISLLIGYMEAGFLSSWAFSNKFIGWLILMGYFLAGGCTKNLTHEMLLRMFKILFLSSWLVGIFCIFSWATLLHRYYPGLAIGSNANHRFIGFLQNPNAFGLFNVVLLLFYISINHQKLLFSRSLTLVGYIINLISIIGSGSRGAFITAIFGLSILTLRKMISFRSAFLVIMTGISALLGSIGLSNLFSSKLYNYMNSPQLWQFSDSGVSERIHHIKIALGWWLESPLMGIGLGSYLNRQIEQNMMPLSTIHQTPLWLLTETGLIGLMLILVFVYAALKSLYQSSFLPKNNTLAAGGLAMILAYALASLTSEIMYQRYLWFFLGMLLVQSIRESQSEQMEDFRINASPKF